MKRLFTINKQPQSNINPLVEIPGDFWLSTIKHKIALFHKNAPFSNAKLKNNSLRSLPIEFKPNNPYHDIYIVDSIQKITLPANFTLPFSSTVFELDYFGLIPTLVLFADPQAEPRAGAHT